MYMYIYTRIYVCFFKYVCMYIYIYMHVKLPQILEVLVCKVMQEF